MPAGRRRTALAALAVLALLVAARRLLAPDGRGTARAFLAEHHGDAWPELERAIEAAGEDLDRPYRFHPWESVAHRFEPAFELAPEDLAVWIEDRVGWPAEPSVEWLEEHYALGLDVGLTADDVAFVEAAVADANHALLETASLWALTLQAHVRERWRSGAVARAPFTTAGLDTGSGRFTKSVAGHGWAVTLTLRRGDHPDLDALEDELDGLAERRDRIVLDLLAGVAAR